VDNRGVKLKVAKIVPNLELDVGSGTVVSKPCGKQLQISLTSVKDVLVSKLFHNHLTPLGIGPGYFVVIMFYDTTMLGTTDQTVGGFHNFFLNADFSHLPQTYAIAQYDDTETGTKKDISPLSHEIGEWLNDPFVNNSTPAWGHIGQQSGCQKNLEVGDPLSGTRISVKMPNGFTYHPQELAFTSWFFHDSPSLGVGGLYSSNGTFTTYAKSFK
jgi:hypothetical protein